MDDCKRFDQIVERLSNTKALISDEDIAFFVAHEETCRRSDHKKTTWDDILRNPVFGSFRHRILDQLLSDLEAPRQTFTLHDESSHCAGIVLAVAGKTGDDDKFIDVAAIGHEFSCSVKLSDLRRAVVRLSGEHRRTEEI